MSNAIVLGGSAGEALALGVAFGALKSNFNCETGMNSWGLWRNAKGEGGLGVSDYSKGVK